MRAGQELTEADKRCLLELARAALTAAVNGAWPPSLNPACLPTAVQQPACCFVTLTRAGQLRGCVGGLEPELPLYADVSRRAAQAALNDQRFAPVEPGEVPEIEIEISVLTPPVPLDYAGADDLVEKLRPGVDGVVLSDGRRRATFLPQVWAKLPRPEAFLGHLCDKLGTAPNAWKRGRLAVAVYRVVEFCESSHGGDAPLPRSPD